MCLKCTNIDAQSPQNVRPFCPLTPPSSWRQSRANPLLVWLDGHKKTYGSDQMITCTALSGGVYSWRADEEDVFLDKLAGAINTEYFPSFEHKNGIPIFVVPQRTSPRWPLVFDVDMKRIMSEEDIGKLKQICEQNTWSWEEFSSGGMIGNVSDRKRRQYQEFCNAVESTVAVSYFMDKCSLQMLSRHIAAHLGSLIALRQSPTHVFVAVTTPRVQCNGDGTVVICNGLHMHLPDNLVDAPGATSLREQLLNRLCNDNELRRFIGNSGAAPSSFWAKVVDPKLTSPPGLSNGLRPLFASKCTFLGHVRPCMCAQGANVTVSSQFSDACKRGGWLYNPCVYVPGYVFVISSDGAVDLDPSLTGRFTDHANVLWALQKTSVRALLSSSGAVKDSAMCYANTKEVPPGNVEPRRRHIERAPYMLGAVAPGNVARAPPTPPPSRGEMLLAIQRLPIHEARQLLIDASAMVDQKERTERELREYRDARWRKRHALPSFPVDPSSALEDWLAPRLPSEEQRRDVPANHMRVWRYDGDYNLKYAWPIEEHTEFLQRLVASRDEPHYFIEGRSFPKWRFFLDLDSSVALLSEHIPLVCLGNSDDRPWTEPCDCSAQEHHIPDTLRATDLNPDQIKLQLALSARLEKVLNRPEYKISSEASLLAQAAAIVRVLDLASRVYVTTTQPRLERFGGTFIIRHGLHLHFYDAIVDHSEATRLRHACIAGLSSDATMSSLLGLSIGQPLAGHFSSLVDPCVVTEAASGTGVRFLYQYKATWAPARKGVCSCPNGISDPTKYCPPCKSNWDVVVQHYTPCQVLDRTGHLLLQESEEFKDIQKLGLAFEKCSVHAPISERNILSPPPAPTYLSTPRVLAPVQRIIRDLYPGFGVNIESVCVVDEGSDIVCIHAQGESHQCANIAQLSCSNQSMEHIDGERPSWSLQVDIVMRTVKVQYRCYSRYRNPTTGIRCLDLHVCQPSRFGAETSDVAIRDLIIFLINRDSVEQDSVVPPAKRRKGNPT
jgi:hypothetical protein